MRNINFTVIRTFPVGNPNRQKDGSPKTTFFGGYKRARLSSQNQNYWLRDYLRKNLPTLEGIEFGIRTSQLPELVGRLAVNEPTIAGDLEAIKTKIVQLFRDGGDKDKNKTQMLFISENDPLTMTKAIVSLKKDNPKEYEKWLDPEGILISMLKAALLVEGLGEDEAETISQKASVLADNIQQLAPEGDQAPTISRHNPSEVAVSFIANRAAALQEDTKFKKLLSSKKKAALTAKEREAIDKIFWNKLGKIQSQSLDVGLFGRMITQDAFEDVMGSLTTAHAVGINEYQSVEDFFTCYDDETRRVEHIPEDGEEKKLHSSTFHIHYNLNLDALEKNVPNAKGENLKKIIECFVRGIFYTYPGGMSLKTSNFTPPDAILIEYNDKNQLPNHANAYISPSRPTHEGNVIQNAIRYLGQYVGCYDVEFPNTKRLWLCHQRIPLQYVDDQGTLGNLPNTTTAKDLQEIINKLCELVG